MFEVHSSQARGATRTDWLDSRHSFSFAGWHDPRFVGFRDLRVLNEDRVAPGAGFGPHPHRDMEILTVVLAGALEHRDSSGVSTVLHAGDVQRMSAGRGVVHSEWNASDTDPVKFLQIWLFPLRPGLAPSHEEGRGLFPLDDDAEASLRVVASGDGEGGALSLHQDATVLAGSANGSQSLQYGLAPGRGAWLQAVSGGLRVGGETLAAGDGIAVEGESRLEVEGDPAGRFLLFDLA